MVSEMVMQEKEVGIGEIYIYVLAFEGCLLTASNLCMEMKVKNGIDTALQGHVLFREK